ncbi:MAG: hypothetical protein OXD54_06875 [Candidatus Poribacteria bacterium]|nr:hypothetical protein [Candidatus Poribacteria bacterium]
MRNILFRVHGTRAERLNFYGGLLLMIGVWLNFINGLLGSLVCGSGSWLSWYALREGLREELSKQQWVRCPPLVMSIISILVPILFVGTIFGRL